MENRKCFFANPEVTSTLFNSPDNTVKDSRVGPSSSGRHSNTSVPHGRTWLRGEGGEPTPATTRWVWVLPPSSQGDGEDEETGAASAAAARAAAAGVWPPWKRIYSGAAGSGSGFGSSSSSTGASSSRNHDDGGEDRSVEPAAAGGGGGLQPWGLWSQQLHQSRLHRLRRLFDFRNSGTGDVGSDGCSRPLLLASLSTSLFAATRAHGSRSGGDGDASGAGTMAAGTAPAAPRGGGGGEGGSRISSRAPRPGYHLPQMGIMRLPGSPAFAEEQDLAQELLDYHTEKHGGFPRPCPRCKSHDFMVRRSEATTTAPAGDSAAAATAGAAAGGGSSGGSGSGGVVEWRSRPLRCDTCGCWVHLGCGGVEVAEQVPPKPWFHCKACRTTFLRLEAAAERNPHPSSASPTHALYVLTPADHQAAVALPPGLAPPAAAAGGGWGGAALVPRGVGRGRGPVGAVMPLLAQGFNEDAIRGFGQPAREYDGGKYSAVLLNRGQPVAAATYNVFGPDAQLCLLATAVQHRLKGNGSALVADLEALLADVGVSRLLVQARGVALPLWLGRLGYSLVPPEEALQLHRTLPIAYYDCALMQKQLRIL